MSFVLIYYNLEELVGNTRYNILYERNTSLYFQVFLVIAVSCSL